MESRGRHDGRRSSRFWRLRCPKIFHEIEDSCGLSEASLDKGGWSLATMQGAHGYAHKKHHYQDTVPDVSHNTYPLRELTRAAVQGHTGKTGAPDTKPGCEQQINKNRPPED